MVDRSYVREKPAAPKRGRGWLSRLVDWLSRPIGGVRLGQRTPAQIREEVRSVVVAGDARAAVQIAEALAAKTKLPCDQKLLAETYDRAGMVREAVSAYLHYADQLRGEGRTKQAIGVLRRVVALDDYCGRAHEIMGESFAELCLRSEAVDAFLNAIRCYESAQLYADSARMETRVEELTNADTSKRPR